MNASPVVTIEQLASMTSARTESDECLQLLPEATYERLAPDIDELPAAFRHRYTQRRAHLPAVLGVRLTRARVTGGGYLFTSSGRLIAESVTGKPEASATPVLEQALRSFNARLSGGPVVVKEPSIVLRQTGAGNYGHWLVDALPRLALLRAHPDLRKLPVYIHAKNMPLAKSTTRLLGDEPPEYRAWHPILTLFEQAWICSPSSRHPLDHHPATIGWLRSAALGITGPSTATRKLFVDREDASQRRLLNGDEIRTYIESHRFERVNCGWMEVQEQIEKFSQASEIIGISGAALTNVVFAGACKRYLCVSPPTMPAFFYWDLAYHAGLRFELIFGDSPTLAARKADADFRLDLRLLSRRLEHP